MPDHLTADMVQHLWQPRHRHQRCGDTYFLMGVSWQTCTHGMLWHAIPLQSFNATAACSFDLMVQAVWRRRLLTPRQTPSEAFQTLRILPGCRAALAGILCMRVTKQMQRYMSMCTQVADPLQLLLCGRSHCSRAAHNPRFLCGCQPLHCLVSSALIPGYITWPVHHDNMNCQPLALRE